MNEMNEGMTGYERLLARCSDEETVAITNAIRSAGKTRSCIISHFDMENSTKTVLMRPPLYEKWTVSITDFEKGVNKIICEDGVIEHVVNEQKVSI